MVGAEVDTGTVARRADHQLQHRFRDIELLPSWWEVVLVVLLPFVLSPSLLRVSRRDSLESIVISMALITVDCICSVVMITSTLITHVGISTRFRRIDIGSVIGIVVGGHSLTVFNLVKVLCYSMLATVLVLCLSRQIIDHLTCQPDVGHGV